MEPKRRIPFDFEDVELLTQAMKQYEIRTGETERSRNLIIRLRDARDVLVTRQPEDTEAVAAQIFEAGAGEGGEPPYRNYVRDGVYYTEFRDGETFKCDNWRYKL